LIRLSCCPVLYSPYTSTETATPTYAACRDEDAQRGEQPNGGTGWGHCNYIVLSGRAKGRTRVEGSRPSSIAHRPSPIVLRLSCFLHAAHAQPGSGSRLKSRCTITARARFGRERVIVWQREGERRAQHQHQPSAISHPPEAASQQPPANVSRPLAPTSSSLSTISARKYSTAQERMRV
jgi:hypothetical protein